MPKNFLDALPDELFRHVYSFIKADSLQYIPQYELIKDTAPYRRLLRGRPRPVQVPKRQVPYHYKKWKGSYSRT